MSGEIDHSIYSFDRVPHQKMAEFTLQRLISCGLAQLHQPPEAPPRDDDFRLVSWVEVPDAKLGHALAVSRPYPDAAREDFIQSRLFCVDREMHSIIEQPKVLSVQNSMPVVDKPFERHIDTLTTEFDHAEFSLILNMLGKVAGAFKGDTYPLDKDVMLALANDHLDELASLFPERSKDPEKSAANGNLEHIMEWTEFIEAAAKLFKEQADPQEPYQEIAIQHEQGAELYAINLCGHYRALNSMQILWQDKGVWQGRVYELDPEDDEDDLAGQQPDPAWDRQAILATVRDGLPIPRYLFRQYLAETLGQ